MSFQLQNYLSWETMSLRFGLTALSQVGETLDEMRHDQWLHVPALSGVIHRHRDPIQSENQSEKLHYKSIES